MNRNVLPGARGGLGITENERCIRYHGGGLVGCSFFFFWVEQCLWWLKNMISVECLDYLLYWMHIRNSGCLLACSALVDFSFLPAFFGGLFVSFGAKKFTNKCFILILIMAQLLKKNKQNGTEGQLILLVQEVTSFVSLSF